MSKDMNRAELMRELKTLIIEECEKDLRPEDIADDATLVGRKSDLQLDSLDSLQIVLAVKQRYGKRIEGSKDARKALRNLGTLADRILA